MTSIYTFMKKSHDSAQWGDIRIFLAIAESGNLVAAAEKLGISQPTAGRRLAALESALGVSLFARTGRRMLPSDAGRAILESARLMQREVTTIERVADGQASGLSGTVTISASEGTGSKWLVPILADLHREYPEIAIELRIEARNADLVQREADIALRMGRPTQGDLITRKLVTIGFGLYASRDYLAKTGELLKTEDLESQEWIVGRFNERGSDPLRDFLAVHNLGGHFTITTNSPAAQLESVRQGLGISLLSHRWASNYQELKAVIPGMTVFSEDLWLVTHEDLRHSARIRAVADHIAAHARDAASSFAYGREL